MCKIIDTVQYFQIFLPIYHEALILIDLTNGIEIATPLINDLSQLLTERPHCSRWTTYVCWG